MLGEDADYLESAGDGVGCMMTGEGSGYGGSGVLVDGSDGGNVDDGGRF